MADRPAAAGEAIDVILVAADEERLRHYEIALAEFRVETRATLDPDEAQALVSGTAPEVLVLDRGLPRLVLFRLYGLVREDIGESPIQIVFVGQAGDTGPDDHYLTGEPSPTAVAERVAELLAGRASRAAKTGVVSGSAVVPARQEDAGSGPRDAEARQVPVEAAGATTTAAVAATATTVSTATAASTADTREATATESESAADKQEKPTPKSRRLDVILIGMGLVLLILGALLIFIQSDAFPGALSAPPATPTRGPAASPKPAGSLPDSGASVVMVAARG